MSGLSISGGGGAAGAMPWYANRRQLIGLPLTSTPSDWLVKDKYSLADIANFCWVRASYMIEIDLNEFPGVKRWVDRIEAREAVQKGVKVGASKSPEEMKKMFAEVGD